MDIVNSTLTSTEESRAGAVACLAGLRAIEKIAESEDPDTSRARWWREEDSAVAAMLHAAGNPSGFMAGFVAVFAEYVKADFSGCGYNLDSWEKPEAAMADEEKIASRIQFDQWVAENANKNEATEDLKDMAYHEASEQARKSIGELLTSADDFRNRCARHAAKITPVLVVETDGYSFEDVAMGNIDQSIAAMGEIIKGGDVVFSPAIHEQRRNEIMAEAFGKFRHVWSDESEMKASIQRFMAELLAATSDAEAAVPA